MPSDALGGLIQEDFIPDPGIGDWFTNAFKSISSRASKNLADRHPKKIEAVRNYLKFYRDIVEPVASFVELYYPNDKAASNVIGAIKTFFSTLDKMVDGSFTAGQQVFDRGIPNMDMMRLLEFEAAAT